MSHGFRFAIAFTLRQEDARDDAQAVDLGDGAGLTKWGITEKHHPGVNVAALTLAGAIEIYELEYWRATRADTLSIPLGVFLFDAAVNHGQDTAVKLLQRAVGVPEDAVIGPVTLAAAQNTGRTLRRFCSTRGMRYAAHARFKEFGMTWMERLAENYAYCIGLPD